MLNNLHTLHNNIANYSKSILNKLPFAAAEINLYFKTSTVKEVVYYTAFITLSHGAHVAFKPLIGDPAAYIATIAIGALMQGNPFCQHQQSLATYYPNLSMCMGGANAILGCKAFSFLSNASNPVLGLIIDTIFSAVAMCKIEQLAKYCADLSYGKQSPSAGCCH